jgi:hypothetical protein
MGKKFKALKDMPEEILENIAASSESSVTSGDNLSEADNMEAVNDRSLGQQPALFGLPNVEKMSAVISSRVVTSVRRLLEERQQRIIKEEDEERKQGKKTLNEALNELTSQYDDVLKRCNAALDLYDNFKEAAKKLDKETERSKNQSNQFMQRLDAIGKESSVPPTTSLSFPPLPKSYYEIMRFVFKDIPLYCMRRIIHSRHVRQFVVLFMLCLWSVSMGVTCLVAYDNARLNTIEKKYILLRDFSRLDERTSQRANYIEWLYSDEDEHRQEIDELWQQRQQRLNNKK